MCDEIHADDEGTFPCHTILPPPPILTLSCDKGPDFCGIPPLFYTFEWQCPVGCRCQNHPPRERECALKGCDQPYKPPCHLMIFCSEGCYDLSMLKEKWGAVCETSHHSPKQLQRKKRKKKCLQTEHGKEKHRQESRRGYARKTAASALAKQQKDAVQPKPEPDVSSPEKPDEADTCITSTMPTEVVISEQPVVPEVNPPKPEAAEDVSPPAMLSENELRQAKHRAILKILFSGEPEPAVVSSEEAMAVPAGVVPRYCKALGCNEVVVPRSQNTEKRFCSRDCMNVFRNTLQNLKEAWKATRCPFLKLLIILLQQL